MLRRCDSVVSRALFSRKVIALVLLLLSACSPIFGGDLRLELALDKTSYVLGEDVWMEICVLNDSNVALELPHPYFCTSILRVKLTDQSGQSLRYKGATIYGDALPPDTVPANGTMSQLLNLISNFGKPLNDYGIGLVRGLPCGTYTLTATYHPSTVSEIGSNTVMFSVENPSGGEQKAWELLTEIDWGPDGRKYRIQSLCSILDGYQESVYWPEVWYLLKISNEARAAEYVDRLFALHPNSPYCDDALFSLLFSKPASERGQLARSIAERKPSSRLAKVATELFSGQVSTPLLVRELQKIVPSAPAISAGSDISLQIAIEKNEYVQGEEIWMDLLIVNSGSGSEEAPMLYPTTGWLQVADSDGSIRDVRCTSFAPYVIDPKPAKISPHDTLKSRLLLPDYYGTSINPVPLYQYLLPGKYRLQVKYRGETPIFVSSNIIEFTVNPQSETDRPAWELLMEADGLPGRDAFPRINAMFREVLDKYPRSPFAASTLHILMATEEGNEPKYAEQLIRNYPNSGYCDYALVKFLLSKPDTARGALLADLAEQFPETRLGRLARELNLGKITLPTAVPDMEQIKIPNARRQK